MRFRCDVNDTNKEENALTEDADDGDNGDDNNQKGSKPNKQSWNGLRTPET